MLFYIFFHTAISFSGNTVILNPLRDKLSIEDYQPHQSNTEKEPLNLTLMNEIKEKMVEINETMKNLINGSRNINETLQEILDQFDSLSSSLDVEFINETLYQFDQLTKNYSNEINRLVSDMVSTFLNEKLFSQEIIVNYVPKQKFVYRADIKPITKPQCQVHQNFTFETKRPHTAKKIQFDLCDEPSVAEVNLHFYLKGTHMYTHEKCYIPDHHTVFFDFDNSILFDKFVIQCLRNNDNHNNNYTIPTFHLFEPKRIRN